MAFGFKTGGRQKGTPNKATILQREKLAAIWEEELDSGKLREMLAELSPKDYVWAMLKITSFVLPKATNENCLELPEEQTEMPEEPREAAQLQPVDDVKTGSVKDIRDLFKPGATMEVKAEDMENLRCEMGLSQEQMEEFIRTSPFVIKK